MKLKTKQIVLLALTLVILSACLISIINANGDAEALNFPEPPAGFTGVAGVDLEVDSGYAWHTMTADEATQYGLNGENVFIAGNSGIKAKSVSNLAIKVTEPGSLTFEYALSTGSAAAYYVGCSINTPISVGNKPETNSNIFWSAKGETDSWVKCTISVDESAFVDGAPAVIYIAYHHNSYWGGETDRNLCAIRNVTYASGSRDNVVCFEEGTEEMGGVSAELVTYSTTTNSEGKEVTKEIYTAANVNEMEVGSTYRLTVNVNSGYQFFGWMKHSGDSVEYQVMENGKLYVSVDVDTYYTPLLAAKGTYVIRKGNDFYDNSASLKTVIESATKDDVLVLLNDATISEDVTVPAGVTLYIPFRVSWEKEENGYTDEYGVFHLYYHLSDKTNKACSKTIVGEDKTYVRLTVDEGAKLSVNGEVVIGAVVGYASQGMQNHVSGAHGRITNNGRIEINDGGTLTCYGIVDGSGTVYANDGADVKESFIISDFAGGSNTAQFFFNEQMPFKRYSMQSVQCTLQMETGADLIAMMNIWALSAFNRAEITLMGSDDEAAFQTDSSKQDTLVMTRIYHADEALADVAGDTKMLGATGIGRTEWTFTGGLTFNAFTIELAGLKADTSSCDFVIPYNFKINLIEGVYSIPLGLRLLPGAEVTIESGASVTIGGGDIKGGSLMVMDGLIQSDILNSVGARYPTREELVAAGFSGSGELTVNGTLTMLTGSSLGGLIKSDGTGTIVIQEGVYLNNSGSLNRLDPAREKLINQSYDLYTSEGGIVKQVYTESVIVNWVQQDGSLGEYDENTTWYNLPARLYTANGLIQPEAGKTYTAKPGSGTVSYDVEYLYVADGVYGALGGGKYGYLTQSGTREMTYAKETVSHTLNAVWTDGSESEDTVSVDSITVAGSDKSGSLTNNVTIVFDKSKNGANTVLSNLRPVDKTTGDAKSEKYVFLVKYTVEGNSTGYTLTPVNGVYTVPAEANGVTIESCLLGDANGNGKVNSTDLVTISKFVAKLVEPSELAKLAWDTNGNGKYNSTDLVTLSKYIAGLGELG